jgi:molybdopterin synthase catalytic subunit
MIEITDADLAIGELIARAKRDDVGAVVTFLGTVRDDGIERMVLEAYPEVAIEELQRIEREALERFEIASLDIVHRVGSLKVRDGIVLIVCAAGHRDAAFAGCRYAIEELKKRVPIWKKEFGPGGENWVPGEQIGRVERK